MCRSHAIIINYLELFASREFQTKQNKRTEREREKKQSLIQNPMVGGPVHCNPQMVDAIVFHRIHSLSLNLSVSHSFELIKSNADFQLNKTRFQKPYWIYSYFRADDLKREEFSSKQFIFVNSVAPTTLTAIIYRRTQHTLSLDVINEFKCNSSLRITHTRINTFQHH